ncbi:MAG TPA: ACP S-malonyltransferase [Candidatus Binataceae bacterium]|nr:ACP S-malonyltransferase [Candidatus Binataceae bacterium]
MKIAWLFPGQGAQKVGMGADLAGVFPAARQVFEEADEALGFGLSRLCFEGPEEELRLTANTQPATLATSIAALRALQSQIKLTPEVAAGHSLGEYSALVAAGALSLGDALRAVRARGQLMQEACPAGQGTMAALIGVDPAAVSQLCNEASRDGEVVVPANLNAPGQIVVSGHAGAVRRALEAAKAAGGSASVELKVSAPFHSPLMEPARRGMTPVLDQLGVRPLDFGVIANVTGEVNRDAGRVKALLLEQIVAPVRWEESMGTLVRMGGEEAIEFGAGRVLMGLMRRINRGVKVHQADTPAAIEATVKALTAKA